MVDQLVEKLVQKALSRRGFLAGAGAATAATMAGCSNSTTFTPTQPTTPAATPITDVDVLNFALNLEYIEAEFYLRGATGAGLSTTDNLGGGAVTVKSNSKVSFSNTLYAQIAAEIAQTELQHVRAIQATIKALGGTPVPAPAIDLMNSFNAVANVAKPGLTFDPFASDLNFIVGALTFEDVGVTAYTGAASLISNATVLSAAAGIQAAEAYHSGALRTLLVGSTLGANATAGAAALAAYNLIIGVRASLGGGNETVLTSGVSASTPPAVTASTIVTADTTNSLAFARTTDQVLHIVYGTGGAAGVSSGGFFPAGLNGNIKVTTS